MNLAYKMNWFMMKVCMQNELVYCKGIDKQNNWKCITTLIYPFELWYSWQVVCLFIKLGD